MDEWVIRGAIAVGAAVVGAIVRPYVGHYLSRNREAKKAHRAMIDSWLEMVRRKYSYGLLAIQLLQQGKQPKEVGPEAMAAFKNYLIELDKSGGNRWPFDPERIPYDEIRGLLKEANTATLNILNAVGDLYKTNSAAGFEELVTSNVANCERLRTEIIKAMTAKGI